MSELAKYIRIFHPDPDDTFVEKRATAIKQVAAKIKKIATPSEALTLVDGVAEGYAQNGELGAGIQGDIVAALSKESPSFVKDGQQLQMLVCALYPILDQIRSTKVGRAMLDLSDGLACASWLALSAVAPRVDEPKLDALRTDLVDIARDRIVRKADASRERYDISQPELQEGEIDTAKVKKFADIAGNQINYLRVNASLDREELDMLWWLLGDWSPLLQIKYSTIDPNVAPIIGALEMSNKLFRLPGESHKHLMFRWAADLSTEITFEQLLEALEPYRAKLSERFKALGIVERYTNIFPLLNSLTSGTASPQLTISTKTIEDWTGRALIETGFATLCSRQSKFV